MVYAKLDATPQSGACWLLIRPVTADQSSYRTCDISAQNPHVIGSGSSWLLDDIAFNKPDYAIIQSYCNGHLDPYFGTFQAPSKDGTTYLYYYGQGPTFDFEENYDGSHDFIPYDTNEYPQSTLDGINSSEPPVPTLDVNTNGNITNQIHSLCKKVKAEGLYWLGLYNGAEVSASRITTIENDLSDSYCWYQLP